MRVATFLMHIILFHAVINDYTITSTGANQTQLVFPAGTRNGELQNVLLTVQDDQLVEGTETAVLYATTQPGLLASFAPDQNRVTISILDDDGEKYSTTLVDSRELFIVCFNT